MNLVDWYSKVCLLFFIPTGLFGSKFYYNTFLVDGDVLSDFIIWVQKRLAIFSFFFRNSCKKIIGWKNIDFKET